MTRYRGRIRGEEPAVLSDRATRTSLVESAERKRVFASSAVDHATETLLAQERSIRVGPMPRVPAAGAQRIDSDEGRHR